jgi:hypothetical protein
MSIMMLSLSVFDCLGRDDLCRHFEKILNMAARCRVPDGSVRVRATRDP